MAQEGFSELIHRLNEVHDREVVGLREKIQELTNKKGCSDTKQMEELFNRNQQLREQQRLMTENIKQLENRLRAGLCDRCTVTQEVAKRRQQEYESSQIQSLQHISILAGEMNALKKENQRLKALRGTVEVRSGSVSQDVTLAVRQSIDQSPPAPTPTCRSSSQPPEDASGNKTKLEHRHPCAAEETLCERGNLRGWNGRQSFDSYKPLTISQAPPPWRVEPSGAPSKALENRARSVETVRQQRSPVSPSIPPHILLLMNTPPSSSSSTTSSSSSSSLPGDERSSRHQVHVPVPYRPRPSKPPSLTLPWTLSGSAGDALEIRPSLLKLFNPSHPHQAGLAAQGKRPGPGPGWPRHSPPRPEPSLAVGLALRRALSAEQAERAGRVAAAAHADSEPDGPLDLSGRGRSRGSQPPPPAAERKPSPAPQGGGREAETEVPPSSTSPSSSASSPAAPPMTPPSSQSQGQSPSQQNCKDQGEELAGTTDHTTNSQDRKVPSLTISLRPVVLLESLNSIMQKQEHSNGKAAPSTDPGCSSEEQPAEGSVTPPESSQRAKRKREGLDAETEGAQQKDRRIRLSVGSQERSPSSTEQG